MKHRVAVLALAAAGSVTLGGHASAQDATSQTSPPAHLSVVDGTATLIRGSQAETAVVNMPLLEGDRLQTDAGRLEVLLPDGSMLHLDQYTTVDLLSAALMRLASGRVVFVVAGRPTERPAFDYQIDAAAGSVRILRPGEYRVLLVEGSAGLDLELDVVHGEATVSSDQETVAVHAGECAFVSEGLAPSYAQPFNSARRDAFLQWSEGRRYASLGYESRQYLPSEIQVYAGAFDRYGAWERSEPYGYVWYPRVYEDWRPYYDGFWRPLDYFGWTWIGYDPWSWPTHHYGRWGFSARGWFWIPGRAWASAWVSWGSGASYVSWCPLGWNDRPVFSLGLGLRLGSDRAYDSWYGWTTISRRAFGEAARVSGIAVPRQSFGALRAGLVEQHGPPPLPGRGAGRPAGVAGVPDGARGRAVPRVSTTMGPERAAPQSQGWGVGGRSVVQPPSRSSPTPVGGTRSSGPANSAPRRSPEAASGGLPASTPRGWATPRSGGGAASGPAQPNAETTRRTLGGIRSEPSAAGVQPSAPSLRSSPAQRTAPPSFASPSVPRTRGRSSQGEPRSVPSAGATEPRLPTTATVPRAQGRQSPVSGQPRAPQVAPRTAQPSGRSSSSRPSTMASMPRATATPSSSRPSGSSSSSRPSTMASVPRATAAPSRSRPSSSPSFSRPSTMATSPRGAAPSTVSRSRPQGSPGGSSAGSRAPRQAAPRRR